MCNYLKEQPTNCNHPAVLRGILISFGSLFWCHSPQLTFLLHSHCSHEQFSINYGAKSKVNIGLTFVQKSPDEYCRCSLLSVVSC